MKIWDAMISGHKGTKYHKMILVEDFEDFITNLKAYTFSDKGIEMGFIKVVDALIKDANVLEDETNGS